MKKIIFSALALFAAGGAYAQGVVFEEGATLAQAVEKAAAGNKMVFVDCFTVWCGPCKMMADNVFPQKEMGDFMNPRFVSVAIDMEKGEGVELASRFGVRNFPTFLLLDGNGKEINRIVGAAGPAEFIANLEAALQPANSMAALKAAYEADRNLATGTAYITSLKNKMLDFQPVVADMWGILTDDEKYTREFLTLITDGQISPDDPIVGELLANRAKFEAVMGEGSMFEFVQNVYLFTWFAALGGENVDVATLEKSAEIVRSLNVPADDPNGYLAEVALMTARKDYDAMIEYFNKVVAPVPFAFRKAQVESGLITVWHEGTDEQKKKVGAYYDAQLKNAKDEETVAHYTGMAEFFANGGKIKDVEADPAPEAW